MKPVRMNTATGMVTAMFTITRPCSELVRPSCLKSAYCWIPFTCAGTAMPTVKNPKMTFARQPPSRVTA